VITSSGAVDTTRGFSNGPSANFRGLASDNGSRAWVSTQGSSSAVGVMFHSGTGVLAAASTLNGNTRALSVQGGQLFVSSGAAAPGVGITPLGALPTGSATAGTTIATTSGTGTPSPYEFLFLDLGSNDYLGTGFDTLYVADDRTIANGGGLQKWTYNGSTWALTYTLTTGISFGLRGLAGELVAGNPVLYVSDANGGSTNSLWTVTDTGAASAFSKIADSPANTQFRGVSLAPAAPEPATIGMLAGTVMLAMRRRRLEHRAPGDASERC